MSNNINFGKGRIVFERARGYLQSLQFVMNLAITIKLFSIGWVWIAAGLLAVSVIAFFFMSFDVKKNMPAEYDWAWRINPAWQEQMQKIDLLLEKVESLEKR